MYRGEGGGGLGPPLKTVTLGQKRVVAFRLLTEPFKTRSGLEPVPGYEPNTYQPNG